MVVSPADLVAEAVSRGIRLYRIGDRVRYEAEEEPPSELLRELRRRRAQILSVLPPDEGGAGSGEARSAPKDGVVGCIDCGRDLGPGIAAGICFPCRRARNPRAMAVEALSPQAWPRTS
jgi:hypothetical protein